VNTTLTITCPTPGTWQLCSDPSVHGRQAHPCVVVWEYPTGLRCSEHSGFYCGHIGLVMERIKERPEEASA